MISDLCCCCYCHHLSTSSPKLPGKFQTNMAKERERINCSNEGFQLSVKGDVCEIVIHKLTFYKTVLLKTRPSILWFLISVVCCCCCHHLSTSSPKLPGKFQTNMAKERERINCSNEGFQLSVKGDVCEIVIHKLTFYKIVLLQYQKQNLVRCIWG